MSYAIDIYSLEWKKNNQVTLDGLFQESAVNETLIHEYVVMYLANQRQNTAKAKTRWEIRWSERKLFRQKWTGRARVGSANSPIRRKWGVTFGPLNTRNRTKKMNQKMKQKALLWSLILKLQSEQIKGIVELSYTLPKTKEAVAVLNALSLNDTKTLLVLNSFDDAVYKTRRNIPTVSITSLALVNPYDILTHKNVVFTQKAVEQLNSRFHLLTQSA
jgi:large subunit ribosomal protein L4